MNFMSDSQRKAVFARLGRSMRGAEQGYIPAQYRGIQVIPMEQGTSDPLVDYGSKIVSEEKPTVSQDLTKGADFLLPYADSAPKYKEQVTVNPYKDVSTEIDKYVAKMKAEKKPEDDIVQISDEYTFEPLKAHKGPALRMSRFSNDFSRSKNVSRGGRLEQKIRSRVDNSSSIVSIRSSGSRSLWDVVCITPDKVRLIQAKSQGYLTPKERERMLFDIQRMPDNVQAEVEYYKSPHVRTNKTIKKAGEKDWDKVEERLDYFGKVRGYRKTPDKEDIVEGVVDVV